jgi:hypothetical protein
MKMLYLYTFPIDELPCDYNTARPIAKTHEMFYMRGISSGPKRIPSSFVTYKKANAEAFEAEIKSRFQPSA